MELHANGDISVLKSSGFEVVDLLEKRWKIPDILPQVPVTLEQGETPDVMVAKTAKINYALGFEVHMSQGDPTIAENWKHFGYFDHPTMHMRGFTSGESYNLRFRLICSKGQGPWSPTFTFTPR